MKFVSESVNQWLRDTRHNGTEMEPTSILMSKCIMPPTTINNNDNLNHSFANSFIDIHLPGVAAAAAAESATPSMPSTPSTRGPTNYSSSAAEIVGGFPQTELRSYDLSQSSACVFDPRLLTSNNSSQLSAPATTMSHRFSVNKPNDGAAAQRPRRGGEEDNHRRRIPIWLEQSQDELILGGKIPIGEFEDQDEEEEPDNVMNNYGTYKTGPLIRPPSYNTTTPPLRLPVPPTPVVTSSLPLSPSPLFKVTKSTIIHHHQQHPPTNPSYHNLIMPHPSKHPLLTTAKSPNGMIGDGFSDSRFQISAPPLAARQESSITSTSDSSSSSTSQIALDPKMTNLNDKNDYDYQQSFPSTATTNRQQQHRSVANCRPEANSGRNDININNRRYQHRSLNDETEQQNAHSIVTHYARPIRIVSAQQEEEVEQEAEQQQQQQQQRLQITGVINKNGRSVTGAAAAAGNTDHFHHQPSGSGQEEDDSGIFKENGDNSSLDSLSPSAPPSMCYSSEESSGNPPPPPPHSSLQQQTPHSSLLRKSSKNAPFSTTLKTPDDVNNNNNNYNNSKTPLLMSSSFSSSSNNLIFSMKDYQFSNGGGVYEQSKDMIGGLLSLCSQLSNEDPEGGGIDANLVRQYFRIIDALPFSTALPQNELLALKSKFETSSLEQEQDVAVVDVEAMVVSDGIRWITDKCFEHISKTLLYEIAGGRDLRNVEGALKDFAHMALLSENASLYIIQLGGIQFLVSLCREMETKPTILRLSLRALAILCGLPKGCIQLLSMGGLDMVLTYLLHSNQEEEYAAVSVEAAGVLTQLTAPSHSFATLPKSLPEIVQRLLDLCDWSKTCETFLLCVGSLGNLSLHHSSVSHYLYRYQGPLRLIRALGQQGKTQSTYIFDQIATILSRLSVNGFDDCLIAQGAIPWLLRLLQTRDSRHENLAKSVRYKAAISLGSIAGTTELRNALELSSSLNDTETDINNSEGKNVRIEDNCPTETIARSLLSRLTDKYQLETVV